MQGDALLGSRERYQLECIVRELVSNALEHSGGDLVTVHWQVAAQRLQLSVADNGRGLPASGAAGSGLRGVRERAAGLGGSATWAPRLPQGLRCCVDVPLGAAAATPPAP